MVWLWQHSPYARYLDHRDWTRAGIAHSLCPSLPAGDWLVSLGLYAGRWLLMSTALMLSTALMPLMFVTGTARVGWMLLLGAEMVAKKNLTGGVRLSGKIGAILFGCAALTALQNLV